MEMTTKEIMAMRALNRPVDEKWINWAADMLEDGYDSSHLRILAGETPPFNQFELLSLADKTFDELGLSWSDQQEIVESYMSELLESMLSGQMPSDFVLSKIEAMYRELGLIKYLQDFAFLYYAQEELKNSDMQWYLPSIDKTNIETTIHDYAKKWLASRTVKE